MREGKFDRKSLDLEGSLTEKEIERKKEFRALPERYKSYLLDTEQRLIQDEAPFSQIGSDGLPSQAPQIDPSHPIRGINEPVSPNEYDPPKRTQQRHRRKTIHSTDYQSKINQALKAKGINPYEYEPYQTLEEMQYQDYIENVHNLFPPESYPDPSIEIQNYLEFRKSIEVLVKSESSL
jgi:hypothetical protein